MNTLSTYAANTLFRYTLKRYRNSAAGPHIRSLNKGSIKLIWDVRTETRTPYGSMGGFQITHPNILCLARYGRRANGWHLRAIPPHAHIGPDLNRCEWLGICYRPLGDIAHTSAEVD